MGDFAETGSTRGAADLRPRNVRVLAIVGSDRSGSTVLDNVLGGIPGVFSAGEVRYLWQRGLVERRLCGCGVEIPDCPVWSRVIAGVPAATMDSSALLPALAMLRTRHLATPAMPVLGRGHRDRLAALADRVAPLYHALGSVTDAEVIVDSSKRPTWARLLALMDGVDVRIVHLIRDPRAVAHSRKRFKLQLDTRERRAMSVNRPATSALYWTAWNLAATGLRRRLPYLRLRYEDVMADPVATVDAICHFAGVDGRHPDLGPSGVVLRMTHTVSGNPSRFRQGPVELRVDNAWRSEQSRGDRLIVGALTAPLSRIYGYGRSVGGEDGG